MTDPMTPWERERMVEFVAAKIANNKTRDALDDAQEKIKSVVKSTPLVVQLCGKTYVVSRDYESNIDVQEAAV